METEVLGGEGHKNKACTVISGCGGEEMHALRTRVTRTINITKPVKKKPKIAKPTQQTTTKPIHTFIRSTAKKK